MTGRRGFALLAVLWVTVALAALAGGAVARAREGADGIEAQIRFMRGRWAAEGCLAAAHALLAGDAATVARTWEPDSIAFANGTVCRLEVADPASRLHADSAPPAVLERFARLVPPDERARFMTRDGDGRVNLNTAPPEVLRALPGFDEQVVQQVLELRRWGSRIAGTSTVLPRVLPPQREALLANWSDLQALLVAESPWLVIHAEGMVPGERPAAVVEEVIVLGSRPAVVGRRVW